MVGSITISLVMLNKKSYFQCSPGECFVKIKRLIVVREGGVKMAYFVIVLYYFYDLNAQCRKDLKLKTIGINVPRKQDSKSKCSP